MESDKTSSIKDKESAILEVQYFYLNFCVYVARVLLNEV